MKFHTLIAALLIASPLAAHAVSFDCKKASTFVEKEICSDATLGKLDDALTDNYNAMLATDLGDGGTSLKKEQRAWLAERNKCKTNKCLVDLYRKRVDDVCEAPVVRGVHAACVPSSDISAGPASPAATPASKSANAPAGTDNPAIDAWAKTCMPLTAPTNLDGQIRAGNVAFRGVKVAAVDTADGGASSLVSVRFDMPSADFKAKFPEFAKAAKLPKSKTCPAGVQRSLADHSMTGAKGATIECNCFTGGD
ncbi:MAG: lysozyme inhibitor LprI family protein [Pseudomonas sp.]